MCFELASVLVVKKLLDMDQAENYQEFVMAKYAEKYEKCKDEITKGSKYQTMRDNTTVAGSRFIRAWIV